MTGNGAFGTVIGYWLLVIIYLLSASYSSAGDIGLEVKANRDHIYIGESFNLTFEISGSNERTEPDLSRIENADIDFLGTHDSSRSSITIINGRIKKESFTGRTYTYRITPGKTGSFRAGPVKMVIDGRDFNHPGPDILVQGIEKQDLVDISVIPSKEAVLVDEPFEVTLSVSIRKLDAPYSRYDPIDPRAPPTLKVPYLEEQQNGLERPDIANEILNPRLVSHPDRAGFAINDYTIRDNFGFPSFFDTFKEKKTAKFSLDRKAITNKGVPCYEYSLTLKYTPVKEGSHTFGPVVFKGNIITGVDAGGHGIGKSIFAIGPACTVRVVPPPEEGRPQSYIGAIGKNLHAEASLDTQTCRVGDPLKLTLTISGDFRIGNIYPPQLSQQEDFARLFRIYEDTIRTETSEDGKEYIYTIRPRTDGTIEVPSVEVSYYNTEKNIYETVQTQPIPLRVNKTMELAGDSIIETAEHEEKRMPASGTSRLVAAPLDMDPDGYVSEGPFVKQWHAWALCCAPFLYFISLAVGLAAERMQENSGERRRHKAIKIGLAEIRSARKNADSNPANASHLLFEGLKKYIANSSGKSEAGLTPVDLAKLLEDSNLDPAVSSELVKILERNFNSAYDSGNGHNGKTGQDAQRSLEIIEKLRIR